MTQIMITNLDHDVLTQLKRLAWENGVSPAEMSRRLLTDVLSDANPPRHAEPALVSTRAAIRHDGRGMGFQLASIS